MTRYSDEAQPLLPFRQVSALTATSLCLQLPQIESDGQELNGRRFRVENGESLGEKEEVSASVFLKNSSLALKELLISVSVCVVFCYSTQTCVPTTLLHSVG